MKYVKPIIKFYFAAIKVNDIQIFITLTSEQKNIKTAKSKKEVNNLWLLLSTRAFGRF